MRLIRSDLFQYFKSRGVPPAVLLASHPEDIKRHLNLIDVPRSEGSLIVEPKKQILAVSSMEKIAGGSRKANNAPFMLMSSRSYDFIALQYALLICANMTENYGKPFWWHSVYGNTYDELREQKVSEINECNLLVIGNVADNSTAMKIEKVRDLLNMYSHIPRILAVGTSGIDPVQFSKQILHIKADYYVSC